MSTASEPQVSSFLKEFKEIVTSGSGLLVIPRAAKNPTITMLGLTKKTVELEILGLSVTDYSSGPVPDRDRPGELWIFGKEINGHEIYIKLKMFPFLEPGSSIFADPVHEIPGGWMEKRI